MEKTREDRQCHLTIRQRKLIKGIAEGKSKRRAAVEAGYSKRSASVIAEETLKNPHVIQALQVLLHRTGLSDADLIKIHKDLLSATKIVSVPGIDGVFEVPDWFARARGLEMAYKLQGAFAPEKLSIESHEERMQRLIGDHCR